MLLIHSPTMSDIYQYPVFFESQSLLEEQLKRIETYFHIRRRSGGGDCGPLTRVTDHVYSVAFRYEKDQQAVLKRCNHVVDGVAFIVRGSLEPHSSSTSQDFTVPVQSQQCNPASTPSPDGEKYELQLDSYLLRYLKECPTAEKELEKQLASVACSAQLFPEEGRILVSRLTQPGAADEFRNWKAEVDKIFDGYLWHYEVDPHKVRALLQFCSFPQTTDEVKVYSEAGLAVVVGERSQVKARLMDVEDSHVKRGSCLREKQTSIHRLGEAKLRLLWKEIEHSLRQDFPGLKVTQGGAGQLILEGFLEEILKAGDWISDRENLVLERTVSAMSPHFLAFLRKAYRGPGVLGHFLGVDGDKVEIDLRDTELRILSLCTDKLDETEKKLQVKFREVKMDVPNSSTVPTDLQEKLKSKTNEMNQGQYSAQVVFGSDSTVCLLGHTKEVEELSEAVAQFILDQSNVPSIIHLPDLKLAQELPKWLQLNGFDYTGVTFHPSTSASGPIVVLEGPSGRVTEVRNRLDPLIDLFIEDRITIDPLGTVRYFTGADGLPNVAHDLASSNLSDVNTTVATYGLRDGFQVLVCQGDITKQDADALVNAANEDLEHGGGVAGALSKAGGPQVQKESRALIKQTGKIPTGDVVVTTGGNLKCKKLLHAVGPVGGNSGGRERVLLEKTVQSALNLAEMMEFRSIAMPCISSGTFGVPVTVCSEAIVSAVKKFSSQGGRSLSTIILIDKRGEVVRAMQEACDRLLQGTSTGNSAPSDLGFQRGATSGAPEGGVHVEIIQGTIETQQVLRLAINNILTSCENRCFSSVALPVLGAGIALRFPESVVARVLQEQVCVFQQNRVSGNPFLVRIVIHPNDKKASEAFKSVQQAFQLTRFVHQPDQVSTTKRIVLLGKTGSGKSNLANTIFGEELFKTNHSPTSGTKVCQAKTKSVNGRSITLIDTPGFFDTDKSKEELKPEIVRCITECAPGPHAFLIVLKVEKFTEQEQAVITEICKYFSEDALKYAVIVFTHGDQLPKGTTIEEFISQNENLSDLVKKCGGRCHVMDNKYWKNKQQNNYRSNQVQVEELFITIDQMEMQNNGGYYTNEVFQEVEKVIQIEEEHIKQNTSSTNMPPEEIRKQAKTIVSQKFLKQLAGTATGVLLGAFFGMAVMVGLVVTAVRNCSGLIQLVKRAPALGGAAAAAAGGGEAAALPVAGIALGVATTAFAATGGVVGGIIGHEAAEGAETPWEAAQMAANAVKIKAVDIFKQF